MKLLLVIIKIIKIIILDKIYYFLKLKELQVYKTNKNNLNIINKVEIKYTKNWTLIKILLKTMKIYYILVLKMRMPIYH
jgi:hypothetical protein